MPRPDDQLTPQEIAELGALLAPARPRPSQAFAARLDARVEERFARAPAPPLRERVRDALRRPLIPAFAATAAVALAALVVAFQMGGPTSAPRTGPTASGAAAAKQPAADFAARSGAAATSALPQLQVLRAPAPSPRKVEQSANLALGAPAAHIDDVAQSVLYTVARFDGIVDSSSVQTGSGGGSARFALRIPAARLQDALAELSHEPHARVLSRSDDMVDVNQSYVSLRRRLAEASAERAGVLRSLAAATTEQQTLQLKSRLAVLDGTIANAERAQRGLDRRISYSRVELTVSPVRSGVGGSGGQHRFTPGRALHDAGRVLSVTAGVIVIAAAALVPLAVLLACGWPLARALRRRRREQALDAA